MEEAPMITAVSTIVPGEPIVVSSDQTPTAIDIRDALLSDERLAGSNLTIHIRDEHVTLSGNVQTDGQREIALNIAGQYISRDLVTDEIQTTDQTGYFCES